MTSSNTDNPTVNLGNLTVSELLEKIKNLDESIRSHRICLEAVFRFKKLHLEALAQEIREGQSTGSELQDYLLKFFELIVGLDFFDNKILDYLRDLSSQIEKKSGQPIMRVRTEERSGLSCLSSHNSTSDSLFPFLDFPFWHYWLIIGIIADSRLNFSEKLIRVPIRFANKMETGKEIIQLTDSPDSLEYPAFHFLEFPPLLDLAGVYLGVSDWFDSPKIKDRLLIGSEAILDWLKAGCEDRLLAGQVEDWLKEQGFGGDK